jgi:hypothetical protein
VSDERALSKYLPAAPISATSGCGCGPWPEISGVWDGASGAYLEMATWQVVHRRGTLLPICWRLPIAESATVNVVTITRSPKCEAPAGGRAKFVTHSSGVQVQVHSLQVQVCVHDPVCGQVQPPIVNESFTHPGCGTKR